MGERFDTHLAGEKDALLLDGIHGNRSALVTGLSSASAANGDAFAKNISESHRSPRDSPHPDAIVGSEYDSALIGETGYLASQGWDLMGENGEFHTLVLFDD